MTGFVAEGFVYLERILGRKSRVLVWVPWKNIKLALACLLAWSLFVAERDPSSQSA